MSRQQKVQSSPERSIRRSNRLRRGMSCLALALGVVSGASASATMAEGGDTVSEATVFGKEISIGKPQVELATNVMTAGVAATGVMSVLSVRRGYRKVAELAAENRLYGDRDVDTSQEGQYIRELRLEDGDLTERVVLDERFDNRVYGDYPGARRTIATFGTNALSAGAAWCASFGLSRVAFWGNIPPELHPGALMLSGIYATTWLVAEYIATQDNKKHIEQIGIRMDNVTSGIRFVED